MDDAIERLKISNAWTAGGAETTEALGNVERDHDAWPKMG